jgi:2,4-dienoyl-CoA reductase-like NADH-dependent reductase (Old Yellow Enzyme family)
MSDGGNQSLFTQFTLGERQLRNRIVMAPMTRAGLATLASIDGGWAWGYF